MTSNCVILKKNQIYWPLSFTGKLSSDFGLLSKMKSNLEDLYYISQQQVVYFNFFEKLHKLKS